MRALRRALLALLAAVPLGAACEGTIDAGGVDVDAGPDDDPLAVGDDPEPGSLDDLHRRVVMRLPLAGAR